MNGDQTVLEFAIRHIWIALAAYVVFLITSPRRNSRGKVAAGAAATVVTGIVTGFSMSALPAFYLIIMLLVFFVAEGLIFRYSLKENFTLTLISFGLSYAVYYFSVFINLFILMLCPLPMMDRFESYSEATDYFVTHYDKLRHRLVVLFVILLIGSLTMRLLIKNKRIRKGLEMLIQFGEGDVGLYLSIALLSIRLLYAVSAYSGNDSFMIFAVCFILALMCPFMIYFWIKKEIRTSYISRNQENELSVLKMSLESKDRLIETLREDNERLAELIHKDNKLIPSMVMAVRKAVGGDGEGIAQAMETADELSGIYAERSAALREYEAHTQTVPSTGVTAVDAVLLFMSERAANNGVEMKVNVDAGWAGMLGSVIGRSEFNVMLADLMENAIIVAAESEGGAVALHIGSDDGVYYLEVLDTGKRFETGVLREMGKRRITTRSGKGGSGIGLMTLFKIMKHTGASMEIEEFPGGKGAGAAYMKAVRVVFDGQGGMRIMTDRSEELRNALGGRFEILPGRHDQ